MRPTTPPPQGPQSTAALLQSTPQSLGTAVRSKDIPVTGVNADNVHPWIAQDIKTHKSCNINLMLQSYLLDCMPADQTTMDAETLFNRCLHRVLPICNGEALFAGDSKAINKCLTAYCKATNEITSYPCFTRAANIALLCLRNLAIDGVREAPKGCSDQLFFHVCQREIAQVYQGQRSIRKPDVVLVSAEDFSLGSATDFERLDIADKCPKDNFSWRSVRTAVEFKYRGSLKRPPLTYTVEYTTPSTSDGPTLVLCSSQELETGGGRSGGSVSQSSSAISQRKRKAKTRTKKNQPRGMVETRSDPMPTSLPKRLKGESYREEYKTADPAVQVGTYGAEMFASHLAQQHAFCLLVVGCDVTIWRYDRQGAIKSSTFNFVQDLPRFLVLLLVMQRFQHHGWGLHPVIDSSFRHLSRSSSDAVVSMVHPAKGPVDVILDYSPESRIPHYGLNGRATNICSASIQAPGLKEDLVAKLYWGEESRTSEAEILSMVYKIAEVEPDVKNHVPEMVASHKFSSSSTSVIRERLHLSTKGTRVLYLIIFKKLKPITSLYGDTFLTCWWHTVKCHLALWKHGIHHGDISPSNLMWKTEGDGAVGVLNDFDLATTRGTTQGNERTGTVPFMAIELLTDDGLAGKTSHLYKHDLESFIWVLAWICLRYNKGKLRDVGNRPLDDWATVDALTCCGKKLAFLSWPPKEKPGEGYESIWLLAYACLAVLRRCVWPAWPSAPSSTSAHPDPSAPTNLSAEEIFFEPFSELIWVPVKEVESADKGLVHLPPPCNPPWDAIPPLHVSL